MPTTSAPPPLTTLPTTTTTSSPPAAVSGDLPPSIPLPLSGVPAAGYSSPQATSRPLYLGASQWSGGFFPPTPPQFILPYGLPPAASPSMTSFLPELINYSGPPLSASFPSMMGGWTATTREAPAVPHSAPTPDVPEHQDGAIPGAYQLTHLITVRLMPDNYLYWHAQILLLLHSRHLDGFIDWSTSARCARSRPTLLKVRGSL
jgi:hypothetical protein